MDNWLLGYCSHCPDGIRPGHIVVLASLRKGVHSEFVVDRPAEALHDEIGPSGSVFWPQNPAPPHDLSGCLVQFHCTPSLDHGDHNTTKDWMRVLKKVEGNWDVHRIGYRIVDHGSDVQWRQEPRWVKELSEGERVFIRQRATSTLVGPWRVGRELSAIPLARELIPHPSQSKVFEYAVKNLNPDSIYSDHIHLTSQNLDFLLYAPDEAKGQPVDLATPKQLAKWLVERMLAAAPQAVIRFDREVPGWRTKIREEVEGTSEPERHVFRARWERLTASLDELVFEAESADKLLQHPKFVDRVEALVKATVEAKVATHTSEIVMEAQQKAKSTVERLEKEIQQIEGQLRETTKKRDEVVRDLEAQLESFTLRERTINELTSHLAVSRERLLRDLSIYQSLLPSAAPQPETVKAELKNTHGVTPEGPPITDAHAFINTRLWPSLDRWYRGVPRIMPIVLHAAACGSRAVIVPTPAWARAYADSLGSFARLSIVNVQPTWLGFDDLWRGGLGCCWERASRDGSIIELVLLRDFNRALPQCYARPLLDTLAGYCDTLPEPGSGCWPKNLRVFACPSPADEALQLTAEVLHHFAAVQREPPPPGNERPRPLTPGYIPAETWHAWSRSSAVAEPDADVIKEFGPLACSVGADLATIVAVLRAFGMSEREAQRTARDIRVSDPAKYLEQSPPEAGAAR